jgi:hypothetical protein
MVGYDNHQDEREEKDINPVLERYWLFSKKDQVE